MPNSPVWSQGLWHLYVLCLTICSSEQSHNIPQKIMRLKQMACQVIELLYQRDKEKVFNLYNYTGQVAAPQVQSH